MPKLKPADNTPEVVEYVELKVTTNKYRVHIKSKRDLHKLSALKPGVLVDWLEKTAAMLREQAAAR